MADSNATKETRLSRREVLRNAGLAGGGLLIGGAALSGTASAETVVDLNIESPTSPTDYGRGPADVPVRFNWTENHVLGDYRSIITIGPVGSPVAQGTFVYQPGDEIRNETGLSHSEGNETYTMTHTLTVPSGTPTGAYDLTVKVEENWPPDSSTWGFSQTRSKAGVVVIRDPDSKADCKNGGWQKYGFRNQGQCIRFVNTGQDSR